MKWDEHWARPDINWFPPEWAVEWFMRNAPYYDFLCDFGCGIGRWHPWLCLRATVVKSIEPSPVARARFYDRYRKIPLSMSDTEDLRNVFTCTVAIHCVEFPPLTIAIESYHDPGKKYAEHIVPRTRDQFIAANGRGEPDVETSLPDNHVGLIWLSK